MPFDMFITSRSLQAGSQIVPQHPDHQGDRDSTFEDNFTHRSAGMVEQTRYIPQRPPLSCKSEVQHRRNSSDSFNEAKERRWSTWYEGSQQEQLPSRPDQVLRTCVPFISSDGGVFMESYEI